MLKPFHYPDIIEAGCDEAGRGCLAGPVFAAAVVLPNDIEIEGLNDSKKLSESKRYKLRQVVQQVAVDYAVAWVDNAEIDKINILNASFLAMHRALQQLKHAPQHILVDGNRFTKFSNIQHTCVIKGDGIYASIAAASILAKTYRDDYMLALHNDFPMYDWKKNKGYPTLFHRNAVTKYGATSHHRLTFLSNYGQGTLNF